jgi:DMSO/TMAO reductase YedYZ molybdopterin-dependent catalytic subunit
MPKRIDRRRALATLAVSVGALPLAGCDIFSQNPTVQKVLDSAESLTMRAQRLLLPRQALAQEFTEADISPQFRANGSTDPDNDAYQSLSQSGFKDWRLQVDGLVERQLQLSLEELRALPARTQITPRLCRGLELHRQMDRRSAQYCPAARRPQTRCPLHRVPLR